MKKWKCENERLMKVRLRIAGTWATFVQVYTATDDSAEELKASLRVWRT